MRMLLALMVLIPAGAEARDAPRPRVSSGFGVRVDPLNGGTAVHRGVDLPGVAGTPVLAAAAGVVRVASRRGGYGELVELAHPDGSATRYAHLSRILVRPGETVVQGQAIGRMGSTGRSTGSHLHFEYRVDGVPVDPLRYLGAGSAPASLPPAGPVAQPAAPEAPHRSRFAQARAAQVWDGAAGLPSGPAALRRDRR